MRIFLLSLLALFFLSCNAGTSKGHESERASAVRDMEGLDTAYFASGCFWCVEHIYEEVEGVKEAVSGFAGGSKKDPSYREVANGVTDHAETVRVHYDPEMVDFETLVEVYYASQDPTTNGQKPDFGPQYRSIIFYTDPGERHIAERKKDSVANSGSYKDPIVTEIQELGRFYEAKDYHQDYVEKNPDKGYVQQVSMPRFRRFKEKMPNVLK
jgi:peptide-methionine (S)-S-oxide reductase